MTAARKPRLGISACLLGQKVRYDGRDKRDPFLVETLGALVEWVPVCPEVEMGMPVPREPIRLVGRPGEPRLVGEQSGTDHTMAMALYVARRVEELAALGLDGWVSKSGSPSCGLRAIPIWSPSGSVSDPDGVGLFVRGLKERLPVLPIEDEERLGDPALRERFLRRVL